MAEKLNVRVIRFERIAYAAHNSSIESPRTDNQREMLPQRVKEKPPTKGRVTIDARCSTLIAPTYQ
jgi:hypothetical protein